MTLRDELIQVAAVAVAIVQDLEYGSTVIAVSDKEATLGHVLMEVRDERFAQEAKWGPQHHSSIEWLAILAEEVGEAAKEVDWLKENGSLNFNRTKAKLLRAENHARLALKERFGPDPQATEEI